MIYIEIENTVTGAILRIPDTFMYVRETFENSVDDVSWKEWTCPVETTAADIRDWRDREHFLYGEWESLAQDNPWGSAIRDVMKKERFGSSVDKEKVIIRTGRT